MRARKNPMAQFTFRDREVYYRGRFIGTVSPSGVQAAIFAPACLTLASKRSPDPGTASSA